MRYLFLVSSLVAWAGCGEDPDAYLVTSIGWSFNYRDWTEPDRAKAPDDLRGCANQTALSVKPEYPPVASVRVVLRDPTGKTPGIDASYDCADGDEGRRVKIIGITRQVYELTLEAVDAEGVVLYRHEDAEHDLSRVVEHTYELETVTGELSFFPSFSGLGPLVCPAAVTTVHYAFHLLQDDGPSQVPTHTGLQPACDAGTVEQVYIRRIPVFPEPGANGNYRTTNYRLVLDARDAGGVTQYCGINNSRPVRPGDNSLGGDEPLASGSCPAS